MKAAKTLLEPARTAVECYAWLPREELTRLAALAYSMAQYASSPDDGQGFIQDGEPWSNRGTFMADMLDNLALLVGEYALSVGVEAPDNHSPQRLAVLREDFRKRSHRLALELQQECAA